MIALIDADIVVFRCAASCKPGDGPEIANLRADRLMRDILEKTGSESFRAFLTGRRNFRYDLYPEYKANRRASVDPEHRESCKEFLIKEWDADISDGIEADDSIGIAHTETPDDESIICSLDKDFKQFAGWHYNFATERTFHVGQTEALRFFYQQVLIGDKSDNIPGYDGKARVKPTIYLTGLFEELESLETASDMYRFCLSVYDEAGRTEEDLALTAKLLYLWRSNPDQWQPPAE